MVPSAAIKTSQPSANKPVIKGMLLVAWPRPQSNGAIRILYVFGKMLISKLIIKKYNNYAQNKFTFIIFNYGTIFKSRFFTDFGDIIFTSKLQRFKKKLWLS